MLSSIEWWGAWRFLPPRAAKDRARKETEWKLILRGTGVQFLGVIIDTVLFAIVGLLTPCNRDDLITNMYLLWIFMSLCAGYLSAPSLENGTDLENFPLKMALDNVCSGLLMGWSWYCEDHQLTSQENLTTVLVHESNLHSFVWRYIPLFNRHHYQLGWNIYHALLFTVAGRVTVGGGVVRKTGFGCYLPLLSSVENFQYYKWIRLLLFTLWFCSHRYYFKWILTRQTTMKWVLVL